MKNSSWLDKFANKEIKSVQILGVTNQIVDTKLHAFLNWQENIQANVYSFFVTYVDGSTKTIQTYDEKEIASLMKYVNQIQGKDTPNNKSEDNAIDQLDKIKRLYDQGVIDEEVYNSQSSKIISELKQESIRDNIHIERNKKRAPGEVKTYLFLDGQKNKDIEDEIDITLQEGNHSLWFQRAALRSNKVSIEVKKNEKYSIILKEGLFSLQAVVSGK